MFIIHDFAKNTRGERNELCGRGMTGIRKNIAGGVFFAAKEYPSRTHPKKNFHWIFLGYKKSTVFPVMLGNGKIPGFSLRPERTHKRRRRYGSGEACASEAQGMR
jgi:hypothetical protein